MEANRNRNTPKNLKRDSGERGRAEPVPDGQFRVWPPQTRTATTKCTNLSAAPPEPAPNCTSAARDQRNTASSRTSADESKTRAPSTPGLDPKYLGTNTTHEETATLGRPVGRSPTALARG